MIEYDDNDDSKEWTVHERADLIVQAVKMPDIKAIQYRQLDECLYTLNEAGDMAGGVDRETAMFIAGLVNMIKANKFTEDMRL